MSKLLWLPEELRAAGLKVETVKGWRTRGRPGAFDPFGVLWHHTGTHTTMSNPHPTLGLCVRGTAALTGPLCQGLIGRDAVIHVIAAGRANHAGTNDGTGTGPIPAGDGNAQMVGWEIDYSGSQDMSDGQYEAALVATSVVLKHFRKDESFTRGHKETSAAGKWDPGRKGSSSPQYLMGDIRQDVKRKLAVPEPKIKYRLLSGEGQLLTESLAVKDEVQARRDRLRAFLDNSVAAVDKETNEDRDAVIRRVKAT